MEITMTEKTKILATEVQLQAASYGAAAFFDGVQADTAILESEGRRAAATIKMQGVVDALQGFDIQAGDARNNPVIRAYSDSLLKAGYAKGSVTNALTLFRKSVHAGIWLTFRPSEFDAKLAERSKKVEPEASNPAKPATPPTKRGPGKTMSDLDKFDRDMKRIAGNTMLPKTVEKSFTKDEWQIVKLWLLSTGLEESDIQTCKNFRTTSLGDLGKGKGSTPKKSKKSKVVEIDETDLEDMEDTAA